MLQVSFRMPVNCCESQSPTFTRWWLSVPAHRGLVFPIQPLQSTSERRDAVRRQLVASGTAERTRWSVLVRSTTDVLHAIGLHRRIRASSFCQVIKPDLTNNMVADMMYFCNIKINLTFLLFCSSLTLILRSPRNNLLDLFDSQSCSDSPSPSLPPTPSPSRCPSQSHLYMGSAHCPTGAVSPRCLSPRCSGSGRRPRWAPTRTPRHTQTDRSEWRWTAVGRRHGGRVSGRRVADRTAL